MFSWSFSEDYWVRFRFWARARVRVRVIGLGSGVEVWMKVDIRIRLKVRVEGIGHPDFEKARNRQNEQKRFRSSLDPLPTGGINTSLETKSQCVFLLYLTELIHRITSIPK